MTIMGSFKKNPKNGKWFAVCFRPKHDEPSKPIKGSQFEPILHQNIFLAFSDEKTESDACPEDHDDWKSRRRRFPRVFKSILYDTASTLSKRKRNKKSGKDISRSSTNNLSSKFEKIFNTTSEKKSESILSSSFRESSDNSVSGRSASLFSSTIGSSMRSSSSSSSVTSMVSNSIPNSRSGSGRKQTCPIDLKELKLPNKSFSSIRKKEGGGNCNAEIGVYLMLMLCLVGLIFWGKAFAIFCTSTCLFLVPCLSKGVLLEENEVDTIDVDSNEYKKKVIMEGLLERNRTRKL